MRLALTIVITLSFARADFNLSKCNLSKLSNLPKSITQPCVGNQPFFATERGGKAGPSEPDQNKKKIKCGSTVIAETIDVYMPADGIAFPGVQVASSIDNDMRMFEFFESCLGLQYVSTYKMPASVAKFYKSFSDANKDLTYFNFLSDDDGSKPNRQPNDSFLFFNFEEPYYRTPITGFAYLARGRSDPFANAPVSTNLLQLIGQGLRFYLNPESRMLNIQHEVKNGIAHLTAQSNSRNTVHFKIGGQKHNGEPQFFLKTEYEGLFDPQYEEETDDFMFKSCYWEHACLIVRDYLAFNPQFATQYLNNGYHLNCQTSTRDCVDYQGPGSSHADDSITIFFSKAHRIV